MRFSKFLKNKILDLIESVKSIQFVMLLGKIEGVGGPVIMKTENIKDPLALSN